MSKIAHELDAFKLAEINPVIMAASLLFGVLHACLHDHSTGLQSHSECRTLHSHWWGQGARKLSWPHSFHTMALRHSARRSCKVSGSNSNNRGIRTEDRRTVLPVYIYMLWCIWTCITCYSSFRLDGYVVWNRKCLYMHTDICKVNEFSQGIELLLG